MASLVVLALALRAFIPAGFMPGVVVDASGVPQFALVICTATGPVTISVDAEGQPVEDSGSQAPDDDRPHFGEPCAFAASAAKAPVPAMYAYVWPYAAQMGRIVVPTPRLLFDRAPTGPAVGSRAPPTLS